VVALALEQLQRELKGGTREELLDKLEKEIHESQDGDLPPSTTNYN
jgi:hypothetical protein